MWGATSALVPVLVDVKGLLHINFDSVVSHMRALQQSSLIEGISLGHRFPW